MSQDVWSAVDQYFSDCLIHSDPILDAVLANCEQAALPAHQVSPIQGKFLQLVVQMIHARSILEIGTLGGYSTIWLARAIPPGGRLLTLESNAKHAEVACANIAEAGLASLVSVRVGKATDSLAQIVDEDGGPFDLIFIDADKATYPEYLHWSLRLSRPGTVIIADNVVREGHIMDSTGNDPGVRGVREFMTLLSSESRISACALQPVGVKGHDGFSIAVIGE